MSDEVSMRLTRLVFLIVCGALLATGISRERHSVHSLDTGEQRRVDNGPTFTQGATADSYMLRDARLYDIYSLSKSTANEKDCKT
jgi:hypothetical protein